MTEETINQVIAEDLPEKPAENPLPEIESVTHRNIALDDGLISSIDVSENIKLESYVNKTIVNDNNVVDVPDYPTKDKILEAVKKMISEPPPELTTTNDFPSEITILQQLPEVSTESTTVHAVNMANPSTVPVATTTPAPEVETIFVPILTNNNENIIIYGDIVTVPTTTDNSQPVSFWTDFINGNETARCLQLSVDVLLNFIVY